MAEKQWVFPPPANESYLPSTSVKLDLDTLITHYLNISASHEPTQGFGHTVTYHADSMSALWSNDTAWSKGDYSSQKVAWHCMPCRTNPNYMTEMLNWEACRYKTNDTLPNLFTMNYELSRNKEDSSVVWNLNYLPLGLPMSTKGRSLLCTLGCPNTSPYKFTAAFRFINRERKQTTGENMFIFNASAPEGNPLYVPSSTPKERMVPDEMGLEGLLGIGLAILIAILIALAMLYCCIKRLVVRRKVRAGDRNNVSVQTSGDGNSNRRNGGRDDENPEDRLPRYEEPPTYVEAPRLQAVR
ncbi:hypothetical protein GQ44DRAFT_767047 [Phaeosphaeriaceae sp. PMI808]|nr:hypothetical protein GQ44DRAFT_767047 [Phaeosphaeriaceae sp. PMI808]